MANVPDRVTRRTDGSQHEPRPNQADDTEAQPITTGKGSDFAQWGSEASGGDVIDKRPPANKHGDEGRQSPDRLGERLRKAD